MSATPDPQPGETWTTSRGRTAEIVARDELDTRDDYGFPMTEVDVIAYRFMGGSMIHLRTVASLKDWKKVEFE